MYDPEHAAPVMKSDGAVVRTSKGMPPAARIASLTTRATPSRCAKHTASSDEELTTAIFGLAMSASDSPSVRQCERRMAELAARLRRVVMRILQMPFSLRDCVGFSAAALPC